MSASAQVLQLIRAHYRSDEHAFATAAQALARGSKLPHVRASMLDAVRGGFASRRQQPAPKPLEQLRPPIEAGGMLQTLKPITFAELELDAPIQEQLDELVTEIEYREELQARKLRPRSRLLFHGPPGNGKTSSAAAIANAIDLPAYAVNLPELISKWVGATGPFTETDGHGERATYRPSPRTVARIVQLHERGSSERQIAKSTRESVAVVRRIVAEWRAI
jgi:hypothetical protein